MVGEVDSVASAALGELTGLPGVRRAAIALVEGGGRRLRFRASDGDAWCHIDAYDDVPLTAAVRTGAPLFGDLDDLRERFRGVVERQEAEGTRALAALPLPGAGQAVGAVIVFFDTEQCFDDTQRAVLGRLALRISESVRRVRSAKRRAAAPASDSSMPHRATLWLDDDPRAVGRARGFLRRLLVAWEVDGDALDTAELCLSELVTNAVIHAGTGSLVTVGLEAGVLRVEVRDHGAGAEVDLLDEDDPLRVFGRGLQLVDALADRWGAEHHEDGTLSWFALEVGSAA
ncbi:MAG: ATP-binding protein [Nocardioides sp.]